MIADLVQRETEPQPLAAGIAALGHLDNPLAVPLITNFSSHPSPEVRFDVAFALGRFPNDPLSAETLLRLTQDTDEDVRDWATFGLGVLGNTDSDEIREALVRRLTDSDEDVREGYGRIGKEKRPARALNLVTALERPNTTARVIETAYQMLGMDNEREGWRGTDYAEACASAFL